MLCMKNVLNVMEGATRVMEMFGDDTFTSAEYNTNRRKGSVALQTLVSEGIVKVVKEERFTMEVETKWPKEYVTNLAGEIIMEVEDFEDLPETTKDLLVKVNNGMKFKVIEKNTEEIEAKRFHYTFSAGGYNRYLTQIRAAILERIDDKEQELYKLKADLDKVKKAMW
jgi:hypothetical protein